MSVTLTPELERLVHDKVQSGLYANPDEVLREALHVLDERDQERRLQLQALRKQIAVGIEQIDRGDYAEYDEKSLQEHLKEIQAEGRQRLANQRGPSQP